MNKKELVCHSRERSEAGILTSKARMIPDEPE
jgi:hypothetical protein